jgi:protein-L-isoaspartate(D-aspartate) O-methyltransferase
MTAVEERERMVDHQLVRRGIVDERVLAAMRAVPRHEFVPEELRERAYRDEPLPIGDAQTISQPYMVALMTEALELRGGERVLEIGTGSGYQAAVLAQLCRRVYTVERHKPLLREAEARFRALRLHNVTTRLGDGFLGWPELAPFDRIIVTAAPADPPPALTLQLAPHGCLVIPLGAERRLQRLTRFRRVGDEIVREDLGPVRFVPLIEGLPPETEASW